MHLARELLTYLTPRTLDYFLHGRGTWFNTLGHIHHDILYKRKTELSNFEYNKNLDTLM